MLRYMRVFPHLDPRFPNTKLVDIFRPHLELYFCHMYSTVYSERKENAYNLLSKHLYRMTQHYPNFGKRLYMRQCSVDREKYWIMSNNPADLEFVEVFVIDHVPFHQPWCTPPPSYFGRRPLSTRAAGAAEPLPLSRWSAQFDHSASSSAGIHREPSPLMFDEEEDDDDEENDVDSSS
jgi:hypothetical protein